MDGDIDYAKIVRDEQIAQGAGGVFLATDPRQELNPFTRNRIDALITSRFPDFVRFLRTAKRSPSPRVPIIMTSARTHIHDILVARDSGINDFVAKPGNGRPAATPEPLDRKFQAIRFRRNVHRAGSPPPHTGGF